MDLSSFRERFDSLLFDFLSSHLQQVDDFRLPDELNQVRHYLETYVQGGKRVRPYLVYLMYTGFGGTDEDMALKAGLSHELTHIFALIHDDIMDKGEVRHNVPTYHLAAAQLYDNVHTGVSQAILVGDLIYTRALRNFVTNVNNSQAIDYFFGMLEEVIVGQSLDIHLSNTALTNTQTINTKDRIKSGNYTFTKPMLVGASLAQSHQLDLVEQLGETLGQAYQMRDDLFDVIEGHDNKTTYSDLAEGNQTIVLQHALSGLSDSDQDMLLSFRGKSLSDDDRTIIKELYEKSGAIPSTQSDINQLLDNGAALLPQLFSQENTCYQGLAGLIAYLRV